MDVERASAGAGIAAVAVAFGAIIAATLASPAFSWTGSALSDLGASGAPTRALFNGGLVVAGLLALGFVPALWRGADTAPGRLAAVAFAVDAALLAGVGLFPAGTALHLPVAVGFYLLLTGALWTHAGARWRAGDRRGARFSFALGAANLAAWVAWAATGDVLRAGLALPEAAGALALGVWTVRTALAHR